MTATRPPRAAVVKLPARIEAELAVIGLRSPAGGGDGRNGQGGFVPPPEVAATAAAALALRAGHGRGGTPTGLGRAGLLAAGRPLDAGQMRQAAGWFARFAHLRGGAGWADPDRPAAGWIAWQLWGGDAGRAWVEAERPHWR